MNLVTKNQSMKAKLLSINNKQSENPLQEDLERTEVVTEEASEEEKEDLLEVDLE